MNINDIQRVLVVGAGTIGQQIALQCAMHGYEVSLYDVSQDALRRATAQVKFQAHDMFTFHYLTCVNKTHFQIESFRTIVTGLITEKEFSGFWS